MLPPEALLRECLQSKLPANGSNQMLLEAAINLKIDLAECNRQLAQLREWVNVSRKKS